MWINKKEIPIFLLVSRHFLRFLDQGPLLVSKASEVKVGRTSSTVFRTVTHLCRSFQSWVFFSFASRRLALVSPSLTMDTSLKDKNLIGKKSEDNNEGAQRRAAKVWQSLQGSVRLLEALVEFMENIHDQESSPCHIERLSYHPQVL